MKNLLSLLVLLLTLTISSTLLAQNNSDSKSYWNQGMTVESSDKNFKMKFGGRIQYDIMFIDENDSLKNRFDGQDGTELRRARFSTSGQLYSNIKFKLQVDFVNNALQIKDAYIDIIKIPVVGTFRVGRFKVPYGFNTLASSNYLPLMERPTTNDLDYDRNLGLMFRNQHWDRKLTWAIGLFYPNSINNVKRGNGSQIVGRIAGLPYYRNDDKYRVIHLAFAYSTQYRDYRSIAFYSRPDAHLAPKYIQLKLDDVKKLNTGNIELAMAFGSFAFQGEYHFADIYTASTSQEHQHYSTASYYGTVSWFATGEHKNYSKKKTYFDMITPKKNFGKNGWGAVELSARYSHINYNDKDLKGGEMDNFAFGVNWYLNPSTKVSANYVHSLVPDYTGIADIFQMRFQVVF